ncbi:hypothetical protein BU15DRAFT_66922 [Melanogaster broomeanus]|nr:hypothetical protein BU15DRAFT_66922 [Melanogaster broomeanus]
MALSPVYTARGAGVCFDGISDIFSYQNRSLLVGGCMGSHLALVRHNLDDITVGFLADNWFDVDSVLVDIHDHIHLPRYVGTRSLLLQRCYLTRYRAGRMSILFSIIRIIHGSPRLKKFTYLCVAFFAACWIILIVEKVWQCATDRSWEHVPVSSGKPYCSLNTQISVFQFTTDCVGVLILVVLPLRMLWRVKLPRRQRRMILSIFASSIVMAFGALFHTLGQVLDIYIVTISGINAEITGTLLVCNLLVVVTYTYRFLLGDSTSSSSTEDTSASGDQDDDFTQPTRQRRTTTLNLTTVDLSLSSGYQVRVRDLTKWRVVRMRFRDGTSIVERAADRPGRHCTNKETTRVRRGWRAVAAS